MAVRESWGAPPRPPEGWAAPSSVTAVVPLAVVDGPTLVLSAANPFAPPSEASVTGGSPWASPPDGPAPHGTPPAPHTQAGMGADPHDTLHWIVPTGRSWQSILSGYLGLIGLLVWPLAPFAVGFGLWAIRRARTGGHGRGRAVFAILTGLIGTALGVWFAVTRLL